MADLGVMLHGLRLRGESHAADIIEKLTAPVTPAVTDRAWDVLIAVQDAGKNSHEAMRAALESARAVS